MLLKTQSMQMKCFENRPGQSHKPFYDTGRRKCMKTIKYYLSFHFLMLFLSLGGIFFKTAANKKFLSFEFFLFYSLVLFVLFVYALVWQQILKFIPLNIAYANKAVTLIWGMIWGALIFKETITILNILGAVVVVAGVLLTVTGGEKKIE